MYEDNVRILHKLPKVVFVKCLAKDGKDLLWTLPGLTVKGLYRNTPITGTWVLDKGRPHPVSRVSRRQLPLTPAFAMTSHAAQGQTCDKGAIVDLKIGGSSSSMSSCVAIIRLERRTYVLIAWPFPRERFDHSQTPGLELLLKVWRREHIDWEAIGKQLTPQQLCYGCGIVKYKEYYWRGQWDKPHKRGNCKACVELRKEEGTPLDCSKC